MFEVIDNKKQELRIKVFEVAGYENIPFIKWFERIFKDVTFLQVIPN